MATSELPDIPDFNTQSESGLIAETKCTAKVRAGYSMVSLVVTVFVSVVLASGAALAITFIGKAQIFELFGVAVKTKTPNTLAIAIAERKMQLQELANLLDSAKKELTELHALANASEFEMNKLTLRVTNIERFASDLEQKLEQQKKAEQVIVQRIKKTQPLKPKPVPIIPIVLASIRNQAGTSLVSLRDGLDQSELLMPGDTWRGWRFLDVMPSGRSARFQVADKIQELSL